MGKELLLVTGLCFWGVAARSDMGLPLVLSAAAWLVCVCGRGSHSRKRIRPSRIATVAVIVVRVDCASALRMGNVWEFDGNIEFFR